MNPPEGTDIMLILIDSSLTFTNTCYFSLNDPIKKQSPRSGIYRILVRYSILSYFIIYVK